jgi:hypothetical protein
MRRRLEAFERRLARVAGIVRAAALQQAELRRVYAMRRRIAALIREGLERAGIDPALAPQLRQLEAPEPPPARSSWQRPDPREAFFDKLRILAERLRGHPPPLATAAPIALLAYYCFGEGAKEAPA